MKEKQSTDNPQHPIGVVSARTGIPQDLLRAWEKRYGAVIPRRSATGRRLYSDADIDKLRLLKRAVAAGRRISDVASIPLDRLEELVQEDQQQIVVPPARRASAPGVTNGYVDEAIEALERFDVEGMEKILADAAVSLGGPGLRRDVLIPMLHTIGNRWEDGSLRIVHEHMASAVVRSTLERMGRNTGSPSAPRMLITTPSGQRHEFGALIAAAQAIEHGWDVIYLNPDLPAEEIAAAVRELRPRAVALSVAYNDGNLRLKEEFRNLRRYLDDDVVIIVGGRAVPSLKPFLESIGVTAVEDLSEFPGLLASLIG